MEQRKVVSLGRSSLVISLPKPWVKLNNIKPGDKVSLFIQRDRSLVVFPRADNTKEIREIVLDVDPDESETSIIRRIIACYLNGYTSIRLSSKTTFSNKQQQAIRETMRKIYMRIMISDTKKIHVITLIDESKASIVSGINRMHTISNSMFHDSMESLIKMNADLAKTVYSMDEDVDHFCFLLLRLLRRAAVDPSLAGQLDLDPIDCLDFQILINRIEYVADHAAYLAEQVIRLSENWDQIPNSVLEFIFNLGEEVIVLFNKAVKSFLSKNIVDSNEVIEDRVGLAEESHEMALLYYADKKNPLIFSVFSMYNCIKRISDYAVDIAEATLNRFYEQA